jgi:ABC-type uncharacterized transport system auxiliary subunit
VRSRVAWRLALALALLAPLASCGVLRRLVGATPLPPLEHYRLVFADSALAQTPLSADPAAPLLPGSLGIRPYSTPGLYGVDNIVFRIDETQYGSYPNREWAVPLSAMLGMMTERVLARRPLTRDGGVYDPPSRRTQAYIWRGAVRTFEEVDRGRQVFAEVRLEAALVRASDDSVLWTGAAQASRPVPDPTMPHIVEALSSLAVEVIDRLVENARGSVRGIAAASTRETP